MVHNLVSSLPLSFRHTQQSAIKCAVLQLDPYYCLKISECSAQVVTTTKHTHSLQSDIKLCVLLLHYLNIDGGHDALQHRAHVWRDHLYDIRVAHHKLVHVVCWISYGGNMFRFPYLRRTLLLEFSIGRRKVGSFCFLGHWLVGFLRPTFHPRTQYCSIPY